VPSRVIGHVEGTMASKVTDPLGRNGIPKEPLGRVLPARKDFWGRGFGVDLPGCTYSVKLEVRGAGSARQLGACGPLSYSGGER
jgi:hypothetical protein